MPDDNPDYLLLDDDGDALEVDTGELRLTDTTTAGTATYTGGDWKHAEASAHVALVEGTLIVTLHADDINAEIHAEVEVGSLASGKRPVTLRIKEDTTEKASFGPVSVALDAVYDVGLRLVGTTATVLIDGIEALEATGLTAGSGSVRFAFTSTEPETAKVFDVRVNRLRYDGTLLEEVVYETWADDSAWTLSGTDAVRSDTTHNLLDLFAITEAMFIVEYNALVDFPVTTTVV